MIPFAVLNSLVSDVIKGLCVNSVMILVVLSTHAELASATAGGVLVLGNGRIKMNIHQKNNFVYKTNQEFTKYSPIYECFKQTKIKYQNKDLICFC